MQDKYIIRALELGYSALGQAWPNPAVGAVIIKDNQIVGEGATARGGRPHAETIALSQAGGNALGASMVVTLEPCSHHGKTPPCTDAIIQAGIGEVVVLCRDPNPLIAGVSKLKEAGITVTEIDSKEARDLNRGFISVVQKKRPFIAMKIAATRDGKIAAAPGKRTEITGSKSIRHTHELRAQFDAILTGIGTVLADDPLFTVRIPGQEHRSPVRVVLDSQGRLPANSKLRQTEATAPIWTYGRGDDVIAELARRGITRLLIEGGQAVNSSFLKSGMVDRIYWYEAPFSLPGGLGAFEPGITLAGWQQVADVVKLGDDLLTVWERK